MVTIGSHCILELYGCPAELLNNPELIEASIRQASKDANAFLLNYMSEAFEPQGVTAMALLAESHISIHTWPELGYAAADVFTCGEQCDPEVACRTLVKAFEPMTYHLRRFSRGPVVSPLQETIKPILGAGASLDRVEPLPGLSVGSSLIN